MNRRDYLRLAGVGMLGALSAGTVSAQNIQTDTDGFQDAAVLVGDTASRPDPNGEFLDDKIRYGYIYDDFENHRRSFTSQDEDGWRPLPPYAPFLKETTQTVANTTTETEVVSYTLIGGQVFGTGLFDVDLYGRFSNASTSDNVTLRVSLGGTEIAATSSTGKNATDKPWNTQTKITAHDHGEVHTDTVARWNQEPADDHHGAVAVDLDTASDLRVTVQWNNAKVDNSIEVSQAIVKRWR